MNEYYSKHLLQLFQNPKNYGKIKNPDAIGQAGNLTCGDVMAIYIKVGTNAKNEKIIKDIKFETFGCVAAIATSSMITTLAKGKTLDKALQITNNDIINKLDGLPTAKVHCSLLATDALFEAIYDYYKKHEPNKITEELEQKHQNILKNQTIIEQRYNEWIKQEKKELNKN